MLGIARLVCSAAVLSVSGEAKQTSLARIDGEVKRHYVSGEDGQLKMDGYSVTAASLRKDCKIGRIQVS